MTLIVGGSQFGYITSYLGPSLAGKNVALVWFFLPATLAMVACRVIAMRWLSKVHPRHLAAWGLVGCSLSLVAMAYAAGPAVLAVSGVFLGLGNSMMYPVASAWLGRFAARRDGGAVQAIVATAFYVGIYWTPWPQTFLIARYQYFGAALIMAAIGILGALALWASRADGRMEDEKAR
jgi:MFS family permease